MEAKPIKVIFLGEITLGKSCLIERFCSDNMAENYSTSTPYFVQKDLTINGKKYEFNFWDTSGYERFRSLTRMNIHDSDIVVLVYDTTNKKSFLELQYWLDSVIEILGKEAFHILVGNKSDLFNYEEIKEEIGKKFAEIIGAKFSIVSAKENYFGWKFFFLDAIKDYFDKIKNKNL